MSEGAQTQAQALFIRGCPRSGTTLLADIMNEDPAIGLLIEMPLGDLVRRIMPIFWYEDTVNRERAAIAQAAARVAAAPAAPQTGAYFIPIDNRKRVTYADRYPTRKRLAEITTAVVESSIGKRDLAIVGSKTPGRWESLELEIVRSAFTRVRYAFVVRSPMDTINSIINRRNAGRAGLDFWPYNDVAEAIATYHESTAALYSTITRFPEDTFVVKYDDLVKEPQRTLAALGTFLEHDIVDSAGLIEKVGPQKHVLTEEETEAVRAAFAHAIDSWDEKSLTGPAAHLAGELDDCLEMPPAHEVRFDSPSASRSLLGAGWAAAEAQGIWSDDVRSDLFFRVPESGRYTLTLEVGGYVPNASQPVAFTLNLDESARYPVELPDTRIVHLRTNPIDLDAPSRHQASFLFDGLRSPAERGLGNEQRRIGICLRSFRLERVSP